MCGAFDWEEWMMSLTSFDSYTEARAHLKDLLDAAEQGRPATIRRDQARTAVVDAERLRQALVLRSPQVQVVAEDGVWVALIPGLPIAVDGATLDEAVDEMLDALREYALDWDDHLRHAPNHAGNWVFVQMVTLSTDDQLREWITGMPQ